MSVPRLDLALVRLPAEDWSGALLKKVISRINRELIEKDGQLAFKMAVLTAESVSELLSGGEMPSALELETFIGMMIWSRMVDRDLSEVERKLAPSVGGPVVEGFADWWISSG